jgi:hypothetical protein
MHNGMHGTGIEPTTNGEIRATPTPRDALRRAIQAADAARKVRDTAKNILDRAEKTLTEERAQIVSFEIAAAAAATIDADILMRSLAAAGDVAELPAAPHVQPPDSRRLIALDRARDSLKAKLAAAERSLDSATGTLHAAAKNVMSEAAHELADQAAGGLATAVEAWRSLDPLTRQWFAGQPGTPGGPIPLDGGTVHLYQLIASILEMIPVAQEPAAVRSARAAADAQRWNDLFARLLVNAKAALTVG